MLHRAREYDARRSPLRAALEAHLLGRNTSPKRSSASSISGRRRARRRWPTRSPACGCAPRSTGAQYVESVSLVDNVLRRDPGGRLRAHGLPQPRSASAGPSRSWPSRAARRRFASRSRRSRAHGRRRTRRRSRAAAHVGYHLVGKGRDGSRNRSRLPPEARTAHAAIRPAACDERVPRRDLGATRCCSCRGGVWYARSHGGSPPLLIAAALLLLIPASELAIALVQRLVTLTVPPQRLPRLDLVDGVPEDAPHDGRRPDHADEPRERARACSSTSRWWRSATSIRTCTSRSSATSPMPRRAQMPGEDALLAAARDGIEALNARFGGDRGPRFFLFHRDRQWNPARAGVDGLGAQARQARRVQPPAARRHRHELLDPRRRRSSCCRRSATASRSTPTRGCRAMRRAS